MKWTRRFFALCLVLALSATVSCTTADPTGPAVQAGQEQAFLLGNLFEGDGLLSGDRLLSSDGLVGDALTGVVGSVLKVTDLLTCTPQPW